MPSGQANAVCFHTHASCLPCADLLTAGRPLLATTHSEAYVRASANSAFQSRRVCERGTDLVQPSAFCQVFICADDDDVQKHYLHALSQ